MSVREKNAIILKNPAKSWQEGFLLGNGFMGQVVYGQPWTETVELSELTFFSGSSEKEKDQKEVSEVFYEMRKAAEEENFIEVNSLAEKFKGCRGNYGTNLPVGKLEFAYEKSQEFSEYERKLLLNEGVAYIRFLTTKGRVEREVFTSHADRVSAYELRDSSLEGMTLSIRFNGGEKDFQTYRKDEIYCFETQALETIHSDGKDGVKLLGAVYPQVSDGQITVEDTGIYLKGVHRAIIYTAMDTDYSLASHKTKAVKFETVCHWVKHSLSEYEILKERHIRDFKGLMERQNLHLSEREEDIKLEIMYQYGRYLLVSSSREDSPLPAHLQGVWNDNVACRIGWSCDMHLDINTQMNYWISEPGNLAECHKPVFRWMEERLLPNGRKTAKNCYGLNGWVGELVSNAWGFAAPYWDKGLSPCPTGGIWQASDFIEHYRYTKEETFLREHAYPVLKEAVEFFMAYVFKHPDGFLTCGPSISPENAFVKDGNIHYASNGCTYEIVLIRELFHQFLEINTILGQDSELAAQVEEMCSRLLPYRLLPDQTIAEWNHDYPAVDTQHRHTSHLLGLFPYSQITPEDTKELADAAEKTIAFKLTPANSWEDTGWARALMGLYSARLKKGEEAYGHLQSMLTHLTSVNYLVMHPPTRGAPSFQEVYELDGNTGCAMVIMEMLLQSHNGVIRILPALPNAWKDGSITGAVVRGGIIIDMEWKNGRPDKVKALAVQDVRVVFEYKRIRKEYNLKCEEETEINMLDSITIGI